MITNFRDFLEYIKADRIDITLKERLLREHSYYIRKYIILLRVDELLTNSSHLFSLPLKVLVRRKRNKLGMKLGFTISPNVLGKGIKIWHYGNIVINGEARLGEYCTLHGNNCIGNTGKSNDCPCIGDMVDIGSGATIIGNVKIAKGCVIGSGAVVVRSCYSENKTLVGVPAIER